MPSGSDCPPSRLRVRCPSWVSMPSLSHCSSCAFSGEETRPESSIMRACNAGQSARSEEHTSELQSLMRISYAVFCLKKKKQEQTIRRTQKTNEHMNNNK